MNPWFVGDPMRTQFVFGFSFYFLARNASGHHMEEWKMFSFLLQRGEDGPFYFSERGLASPREWVYRSFSVTPGQGPSCLLSDPMMRNLEDGDPYGMGLKKGGQGRGNGAKNWEKGRWPWV